MYDMPLQRADSEPRVDMEASVHIQFPGQEQTIRAITANISESGMFVKTSEAWAVNSELHCDLSLPAPFNNLPVRGRVVWVQDQPTPGVGIQFIELDQTERDLLRKAISARGQQETHEEKGQPVKVWFERLTHPLPARATQTESGILLRYPLPHLVSGSMVVVYPSGAAGMGLTGILQQAYLEQDPDQGPPHLCVHLAEQQPDIEQQANIEPQADIEQQDLPDLLAGELVIEPADPDSSDNVFELAPKTARHHLVDDETITQEPETQQSELLLQPDETPYSLSAASERVDSQWNLEFSDHDVLEEAQRLHQRSTAKHPWLWTAALLMTGITIGSMVYTNLWDRLYKRYQRWTVSAAAEAATSETLAPVIATTPDIPDIPHAAPPKIVEATSSTSTTDKPKADKPKADKPKADKPTADKPTADKPKPIPATLHLPDGKENEPRLTTDEGKPSLVIPVRGSIANAVHYPLADPDGIVVNLPRAKPKADFGTYRFGKGKFRMLWLRRREGGVHLRVLFRGKLPEHTLKIEKGRVQVTLKGQE